ncbi:uncharacterized protein LOC108467854 [Gossypium arboreum]|uniref:Homeobox domain-containing protein n=1 Tax=Gossypium arboreum TaxID=29729 RepID=A0ABR0NW49_GOSAR|nr:uncharacterized protein LOC108467854 [Gossypium arboreum]KAK5810468.1 hypothetical protein PVK06_025780 [Gossypium arboreum]
MEGEVQTEENKVSLDVNKKRTVKTPAQVMALEKFYKELRFPSDEMKAQIALQVGLTEKQISSWFCHRRLKDKKRDEYVGRLDHSSGIIQDRGSGLWQDSSGSIKERDYRNIDLREVESGGISSQEFLATDHVYDRRNHQNPYDACMEDTSSESSSSLQDMRFSENRGPYETKLGQNGTITQINPRTTKNTVFKPSGYLKLKGESENPAILAVKRQLGRYYIEDGPLLATDFDSLPNAAFEFPSSKVVSEPVDVGDHPQQPRSPRISGAMKQPNPNVVNEVHNSKTSSQDPYMENATFKTVYGLERQNKKSRHQLYKSHYNSFPGQNSSSDIHRSLAENAGTIDCKRSKVSSKLAVERMRPDSFTNHPGPNVGKLVNEQEKTCLHDDDNRTYKAPKNKIPSKTSNSKRGCIESPGARMAKVEKLGGQRKPKKEHPVGVKTDPTNESRVAKQVNVDFPRPRSPLSMNPTKSYRPSMDVPSSFSEDETADTSSSSG